MKRTDKKSSGTMLRIALLALALCLSMAGCDLLDGLKTDKSPTTTPPPVATAAALKAVPMAASQSSQPIVLDSYTDGTYNFYLIDVGRIENTLVAVVYDFYLDGYSVKTVTQTEMTETHISSALTETVTNSVTVSDTQQHTAKIDTGWKSTVGAKASGSIPGFGKVEASVQNEFHVNLGYQWSGSWTNSSTNSKSFQTSLTEVQKKTSTISVSTVYGGHGEPVGNYRYALYATSDVYFLLATTLDNSELLRWETVAGARSNTLRPHLDYSADGFFDTEPNSGIINFSDDFYKRLPVPSSGSETYTVVLDKQGGTNGTASVEAYYGRVMPKANAPTKGGYAFMGYWEKENGQGKKYYDSSMTSLRIWDLKASAKLYAYWVPATQTLPLLKDGIGEYEPNDLRSDWQKITLELDKLRDAGYTKVSFDMRVSWCENSGSPDCTAAVIVDYAANKEGTGRDNNAFWYSAEVNPGAGWKEKVISFNHPIDDVINNPFVRVYFGYKKRDKNSWYLVDWVNLTITALP